MKNERQGKILEVAKRLFLHHGFQKVTLGDIAAESGVSRPTVYQAFSNKEEIFNALIEDYHRQSLERVDEVRSSKKSVGKKIEEAIEIWIVEPYELLLSSPGAEELLDCTFGFASAVTDAGYEAFEKEVQAILEEGESSWRLPSRELAHFMVVSMRGFKSQAGEVRELRKLIKQLLALSLE